MWWRGVNIKEDTSWAQFVCSLPCCWWKHGRLLYRLFVLFRFHFLISWASVVCSVHGRLHFILIHRCSSIVRSRIANRSKKEPPMVIEKKKNYGRLTGKTNISLTALFHSCNLVCCEFRRFIVASTWTKWTEREYAWFRHFFHQFPLLSGSFDWHEWIIHSVRALLEWSALEEICVHLVGDFSFRRQAAWNGRDQKFQQQFMAHNIC